MATRDSFIHIARPLASAGAPQPSIGPLNVVVRPQVVFSILDHALRRNDDESQKRVIGALLGTRSEDGSEIEIRSSFAVHHSEADDHITLDVDYYKRMQILHTRVNPQEVLVGWYATSHELDNVSPLIHNFFSDKGYGTWPHPAVHVTVSTEPGKPIDTHTYISAPLWVKSDLGDERALFVPVPHEVRYTEAEKTGMDALTVANNNEDRVASLFSDMEILEKSICEVLDMIDRVGKYVEAVLDEEAPVSAALGQFLLNALAVAPYSDFEENFNNHIQDILVVSYLSNQIRTQMELANKLATSKTLR